VGNTGSVPRFGIPSLCLEDSPLGVAKADNITAFPAGITVGATWDRDLMYIRGQAIGAEARGKGVNVQVGLCLASTPVRATSPFRFLTGSTAWSRCRANW
jgi:beta-glucosidase-like glycosyl hydrolase